MSKNHKPSALTRAIEQALGQGKTFGNADDDAAKQYPHLWEWLTTCYVGANQVKNPATLSIAATPGGITARISDRDLACAVAVTVKTLVEVFPALELVLSDPSTPIQTWGRREPQLRKRKS